MKHDIRAIARHFQVPEEFVSARSYGSGHINDTYKALYRPGGQSLSFIHQRINHAVFKRPIPLMHNVHRVTSHQRKKLKEAGISDLDRRALKLVPSKSGLPYHQDDHGNVWRTYAFVENVRTHDFIEHPSQAFQAARAFGEFQRQLIDLGGDRLDETIPDFHNTPKRFEAFAKAVEADPVNRAAETRQEIDFALGLEGMTEILLGKCRDGLIPERVVHNDTKVNNVMLDNRTGEGICVVDLDTVMPGLVAYDFGDMVRTYTSPTEEDERDLSKIRMEMPLFSKLVDGYLETAHTFLTPEEKATLVFGGKLITFEQGIRFLTDHLLGDVYYKIHREGQNVDRCRTQFRLVELIAEQEDAMSALVDAWEPQS